MTPVGIIVLYLAFFGVEFLFENILTLLNLRTIHRNSGAVPVEFRDDIDSGTYRSSVAYNLTQGRFSMFLSVTGAVIVLAIVLSGFLGVIDNLVARIGLSAGLEGALFVAIVAAVFHVAAIPGSLYSQFSIEKRYGFNTMTAKTYILDEIKGLALSVILGVPVLLLFFRLVTSAGQFWWIYAFAAIAAFQLIITVIYPVLIAPLFNRFSPLEEGTLKTRIGELVESLKFSASGVLVMDGSKRSRHSNAYFTGFGRGRRIVLYDTLIRELEDDEIMAVLAHEIGHQKRKHIIMRLAVSLLLTLLSLWIIGMLINATALFTAFGMDRATAHGLLVVFAFCSGPFTFMLKPLFTSWSRRHEYQADRFASENGGRAGHLKRALIKLGKNNKTNLSPHPLYSFFHYSHPTLAERVAFLTDLERSDGSGAC